MPSGRTLIWLGIYGAFQPPNRASTDLCLCRMGRLRCWAACLNQNSACMPLPILKMANPMPVFFTLGTKRVMQQAWPMCGLSLWLTLKFSHESQQPSIHFQILGHRGLAQPSQCLRWQRWVSASGDGGEGAIGRLRQNSHHLYWR